MTAGPLTLEDLERLERSGDNVRQHSLDPSSDCAVAADAIDELLAALRSVMADLAEFKAENIRIETDRATLELRALAAEHQLRSVMAERDALQSAAKGFVESCGQAVRERDEAREQVRSLTVERDAAREGRWAEAHDQWQAALHERDAKLCALRARLSRAREALDDLWHAEGCRFTIRERDGCDCGLDKARAALAEPGEPT